MERFMQKSRLIILLLLTTLAAIAAAWFWALPPLLTPLSYFLPYISRFHPVGWTDADYVRHIWHLRLVQPEWVSTPPEYSPDYLRWARAETSARLIVVFLGWTTSTGFIVRRYFRSHKDTTPNRRVERTGGSRLAQRQIERHRRLPPVAHPECWTA